MLQVLIRHFIRGLLIVVPIAVTVYVVWAVVSFLDGWLNLESILGRRLVPGVGLILTVALVTLVGVLGRVIGLRWLLHRADELFARLPLIKILYTSIRDLTGALVGERKRFDRPVAIAPAAGSDLLVLGFMTRDDLDEIGLPGLASVYVPQSYNFAGNLVLVPKDRVRPLEIDSTRAMKLIVSGGVTGQEPASTR